MQNRNFTQKNISKNHILSIMWVFAIVLLSNVTAYSQCPDGQTNLLISMNGESFPGDNGWVLWDATANAEVLCQETWTNGSSVSACVTNGNDIELYTYDSFGDGWDGVLTIETDEDASAYTNGCAPNQGQTLFSGTYTGGPNGISCGTDPSLTGDLLASFSTNCITCELTCPSDIVITAEPGLCGADVTIPVPTVNGVCNPDPVDMSGFYPVGTTEVIFEADANNVGGPVACSIFVTVEDNEAPELTLPNNITLSLGGGECTEVYNYSVGLNDACGAMDIAITQSTDPVNIESSFACPGGNTSYYRVFDLENEGITTDVNITDIEIGVFEAFNLPTVTVGIYELEGLLSENNLTLVAENSLMLDNSFLDLVTFPIVATLEADKTYVVKVETPGTIFNGFVMGMNSAGQTAPSYIQSTFCEIFNITNLVNLSPTQQIVMSLYGSQAPISYVQTQGVEPGGDFPIGTTTNIFEVTDASGNVTVDSFSVTVNEFANPITTLACNNLVNVSLDKDCEGLITPDMVLEGGPYACYDTYTVVILDTDENAYGDMITGDMVGLELTVEVYDQDGNKCWGDIVIEDKLGPLLECSTRTTQCTEDTDPGSPLAGEMRFDYEPNTTLSNGAPSSVDIPLEITGLDNAILSDINVELDINHTWVSDLGAVLVSPEGTEVTLFLSPGTFCDGNNLSITLDDEATLTDIDLANTCTDDIPTIVGSFQPAGVLSAFDGEDPNGTWILRINDFFVGDGGIVQNVTLEISQVGGSIGLPIPDGATYTNFGDQTYYVFGLDPCGPAILSYEDQVSNRDCTSPFTKVIYRTYTATDASGNSAVSCVDTINVLRTDLGSLEFPPNYDDLDLPSLSCSSGYPTPAVTGFPTGAFCDNVQMDYQDVTIDICEGSYKILRYWSVFEWCESEIVEYTQIIKVSDKEGPSIQCPVIDALSTSPSDCQASLLLPVPVISDNCTATPTYTIEVSGGTLLTQGSNYSLVDLGIGTYTVTYTAFDNCGNSSDCSVEFTVGDDVSPVAVCEQHTTVALSFDSSVEVNAETFDDGSYDECSDITWSVRRMDDPCGVAGNTTFGPAVTFCCEDVGETVMVSFRVEDAAGNFNTCMVEVEVQDKIAPAIEVPGDVTLNCQDDYTDLNLTGGLAVGFDNCDDVTITYNDFPSIGSCGSGQVSRVFTATDKGGLTVQGTQKIFLIDNDPFDINDITFPSDVTVSSCTSSTDPESTGEPMLNDDICSQVSFTYWDDKFVIVEGSCEVIYRKWTVIDQCQFTNGNNNLGIWEDIQVIEMINNNPPEFTSDCTNTTFDGFGNCEEEVTLSVDAIDDCTPADKLTYTWKIDLDNTNDGTYDYQGTGNTVTGVYPFGTHRILWIVSDNCGNTNVCEYLFTIEDAKAPTPYCISTLSTAVMSTDGTVEIWASDFALQGTDNCTAPEDILLSFTEFGITTSMEFSCDDIPNGVATLKEDIKVWFVDEAGNRDYCTVSLILEDNEAGFCEDVGTLVVEGELTTPDNEMIQDVDVILKNFVNNEQLSVFSTDGTYSFDLVPDVNYEVTAEKNNNILNGVTTLDIVLVQKHILGIQTFDSPYKTIAADTDNSGHISGADIIAIRKLILGFKFDFPNDQQSWRFVDRNMQFADNWNVFPYDEIVNLDFTNAEQLNDFAGVKIGDINQNADPAGFNGNIGTRSTNPLELIIDNVQMERGETYELPVYASNFDAQIAMQMTLEFNTSNLEIVSVKEGALEIKDQDINMADAQNGMISMMWASIDAKTISEDQPLFVLLVKSKVDTKIAGELATSNRLTETISYNESQSPETIEIVTRDKDQIIPATAELVVYQNVPNPFNGSTNISFDLPKTDQVDIQIFDVNGALVKNISQTYKAGFNTVMIQKEMLGTSGVYYYTVSTSEDTASMKMILID